MATIDFFCPHCGKGLQSDERGAGLQITCPDCQKTIAVPSFGGPAMAAPGRPTVVTVFGVINIVFGCLGLLCTPVSLIMVFALADQVHYSPVYLGFVSFSSLIGMVAAGVLLASGVGLLKCKRWAPRAAIGYALVALIMGVIGMVANLVVMTTGPMSRSAGAPGGIVGGCIGGTFGLIYPIVLLIFMTKPAVKDSCVE